MRKSSYQDLQVWQKGMDLCVTIYGLTSTFPSDEKFGLTSQLRRASSSIPANIAEGHGRGTDPDFARFLRISLGSTKEVETFLALSLRLGFLSQIEAQQLLQSTDEIARMLFSLIKKLKAEG